MLYTKRGIELMVKKMPWEWEVLDNDTYRAKVIGGWLVAKILKGRKSEDIGQTMVFVNDQDHMWVILKPKEVEPVKPSIAEDFASRKE
jgi:hypothetical protein